MYRLVLICLVGLAAAGKRCNLENNDEVENNDYWGSSTGRHRQTNSVEISAAAISRKLIDAHSNMGQFCSAHSDRPLREVYGVEHFQLRVRLSEFTAEDIQVKVWQRLVLVHAQNCSSEYASLRILPDVVDTQQAVWRFKGSTLTVYFPYAITPDTKLQSRCGRALNPSLIIVPKCAADRVFNQDYDVSFGDDKLRRALLHHLQQMANEGHLKDNSEEYINLGSDEVERGDERKDVGSDTNKRDEEHKDASSDAKKREEEPKDASSDANKREEEHKDANSDANKREEEHKDAGSDKDKPKDVGSATDKREDEHKVKTSSSSSSSCEDESSPSSSSSSEDESSPSSSSSSAHESSPSSSSSSEDESSHSSSSSCEDDDK